MTTYTQQQLVDLYKQLFPLIKKNASSIDITIKGQTVSLAIASPQSEVTSTRIVEYR